MKPQAVLKTALKLDPDDRCRVADALYESVNHQAKPNELSDEFKRDLDILIEEHDRNPKEGISWEELKKTLRPKRKKRIPS